eukprot:4205751-Pleurochrysis_carterae.AAC.1
MTISTLARARQILKNCRRASLSFAIDTHMHGLKFGSRIACILAGRSRSAHLTRLSEPCSRWPPLPVERPIP